MAKKKTGKKVVRKVTSTPTKALKRIIATDVSSKAFPRTGLNVGAYMPGPGSPPNHPFVVRTPSPVIKKRFSPGNKNLMVPRSRRIRLF